MVTRKGVSGHHGTHGHYVGDPCSDGIKTLLIVLKFIYGNKFGMQGRFTCILFFKKITLKSRIGFVLQEFGIYFIRGLNSWKCEICLPGKEERVVSAALPPQIPPFHRFFISATMRTRIIRQTAKIFAIQPRP